MPTAAFTAVALSAALVVACVVSLGASAHPDGLEYVAEGTGFLSAARDSAVAGSPFADYAFTAVSSETLGMVIAGAVGCAVTFCAAWVLGRAVRARDGRR